MSKKPGWIINILLIASAAILLAGCGLAPAGGGGGQNGGSGAGGAAVTDPHMLLIPRWMLAELTLDGKATALLPDQRQSIQFTPEQQVSGEGGCNSFGGSYQAGKDGSLSFGPMMSTMMACEKGMEQESAYLQALSKVKHFELPGGKLVLSSDDHKTTLVFVKPPK